MLNVREYNKSIKNKYTLGNVDVMSVIFFGHILQFSKTLAQQFIWFSILWHSTHYFRWAQHICKISVWIFEKKEMSIGLSLWALEYEQLHIDQQSDTLTSSFKNQTEREQFELMPRELLCHLFFEHRLFWPRTRFFLNRFK